MHIWIFLLLVVAFVVWHFIPEHDPEHDRNQPAPRFRKETRAVETDPNWAKFIEAHCESPAETGFLRAIIKNFDLRPSDGSLCGSGLRLDFQVEEGRYRVDFLANKWLVVEIDGAAWHSSPEAIERDKKRDKYFEGLGYSVLRIPAKVVFNEPGEAVKRVRSALQKGKRTVPARVQKSGWQRLSDTASAFRGGLHAIHDCVLPAQVGDGAVVVVKVSDSEDTFERFSADLAALPHVDEVHCDFDDVGFATPGCPATTLTKLTGIVTTGSPTCLESSNI